MTVFAIIVSVVAGIGWALGREDDRKRDTLSEPVSTDIDPQLIAARSKLHRVNQQMKINRSLLLLGAILLVASLAWSEMPSRARGSILAVEFVLGLAYVVLGSIAAYHATAIELLDAPGNDDSSGVT